MDHKLKNIDHKLENLDHKLENVDHRLKFGKVSLYYKSQKMNVDHKAKRDQKLQFIQKMNFDGQIWSSCQLHRRLFWDIFSEQPPAGV